MHRHVKVAHNSFVEGSHMAKNTASGNTFQTLLSRTGPGLAFINPAGKAFSDKHTQVI